MKKSILNLEGAKKISAKEQKTIAGGTFKNCSKVCGETGGYFGGNPARCICY